MRYQATIFGLPDRLHSLRLPCAKFDRRGLIARHLRCSAVWRCKREPGLVSATRKEHRPAALIAREQTQPVSRRSCARLCIEDPRHRGGGGGKIRGDFTLEMPFGVVPCEYRHFCRISRRRKQGPECFLDLGRWRVSDYAVAELL
jgi:hypothetical protein